EVEAKQRLAVAAAASVQPEETIFVDSSTTAYRFAAALVERGIPLTLLTNSLPLLGFVGNSSTNVELVGLGGSYRKLTQSFAGPDAVRRLEDAGVDVHSV